MNTVTGKSQRTIAVLNSIQDLPKSYAVWACDIWGVLHDGIKAFTAASEACARFRQAGGRVILITNAPRPFDSVAKQLQRFGVPDYAYDAIISSGDVTHNLLETQRDKNIFHLGPARDYPILERALIRPVSSDEADIVLCTGLYDDDVEGPEDYREQLEAFAERELPMICANPDIKVERGHRLVYCAGALAALYGELGGQVDYAGKPHRPIYQMVRDRAAQLVGRKTDDQDILAIGDGLLTDMAGAFEAGFDALFVASGLHFENDKKLTASQLETMFPDPDKCPVGAMTGLR